MSKTGLISFRDKIFYPYTGCYRCCNGFAQSLRCATYDDDVNEVIARIYNFDPDGIIVRSPVHY
tara:strand:- start:446 stop:637 length:192 start_codon:yes stop_codon:yes gene_type:complete